MCALCVRARVCVWGVGHAHTAAGHQTCMSLCEAAKECRAPRLVSASREYILQHYAEVEVRFSPQRVPSRFFLC